jgi:hypothetical protein
MIPLSTLSPINRLLSRNRPQPQDPSVLRFSRLFKPSPDQAVTCLRQIIDVHQCSAEIEALLSELDEVKSSFDESPNRMEWSLSGRPRTKVLPHIPHRRYLYDLLDKAMRGRRLTGSRTLRGIFRMP